MPTLVGIAAVASVGTWLLAFFVALAKHNDVTGITEDSLIDASALQISQLVDQALLQILPYVVAALGLTTLFVVLFGFYAVQRLSQPG